MEAAERFRQGDENTVIAHDLRSSVRSVQRWRKAWSQDGPRALASKGPASLPLLSDELFAVLERELAKGPVAHGWRDQTWTLSRIKTLLASAHVDEDMRRLAEEEQLAEDGDDDSW
ncbi:hypothetical protein OIE76_00210 [Streptomyces sp. NBC_01727]|nr:hypothetical protein OIE76_00210 [Streptomyces sp. NBC_01727]